MLCSGVIARDHRHGFGRQEYAQQQGGAGTVAAGGGQSQGEGQGKVYEGDFVAGRLCGTGCMRYPDGSSYCGGMKDDMRSGEGVLTLVAGAAAGAGGRRERERERKSIYRGAFRLGKRHGKGVLTYPASGDVYSGTWGWDVFTPMH